MQIFIRFFDYEEYQAPATWTHAPGQEEPILTTRKKKLATTHQTKAST